jgi:pyrroline-5-carboxylate reductase
VTPVTGPVGATPVRPLAVIGAGSLARTLLAGWTRAGIRFPSVVTVSRRSARAAELAGPGVTALSIEDDEAAAARAVRGAGIVVLAVKPWMLDEVAAQIAGALEPGAIVVSVMAGVRLEALRAALGGTNPIVRALPNTPSQVNAGVAGLVVGDAGPVAVAIARDLFGALGDVIEVDEDGLDALTVLSGSGPALAFLLAEKLAAAAEHQGFSPDTASRIARGVLAGAGALVAATEEDPEELRRRVTSVQGVTHYAVSVLEERDLGGMVIAAADAGRARARELATTAAPAAAPPTSGETP